VTSSPQGEVGRKRRSDFEQNRNVILEAANEAFADVGPDVSVNVIAKWAGVAPATVYRHFPNRQALGEAVYNLRLDLYLSVVTKAQESDDPADAFRRTIHGIVDLQAKDRSFKDLIATYEKQLPHVDDETKLAQFGRAMLAVFDRAREAGAVRADVTNADIALLLLASEGIARLASEHSPLPLQRIVNILLDGTMGTRTDLTGTSLSDDELFKLT
jgi:AcrR family transcriptional regulator